MHDIFGFHCRDAKDGLKSLVEALNQSGQQITTTITSPPYLDLKDYGSPMQLGHDIEYDDYLQSLVEIFKLVHTATEARGSLWLVANSVTRDGKVLPIPFDLGTRLDSVGWTLRDVIIWEKGRNLPWSNSRFRNVFEYVLLFSKNHDFKFDLNAVRERNLQNIPEWWVKYPERYSPYGVAPSDIWSFPIPVQGTWRRRLLNHFHVCPFPARLVERMILLSTQQGDIVLDPFAGSGVVLATAESLGRRYVGFDVQPKFVRLYETIIRDEIRSELDEASKGRGIDRDFQGTIESLRLVKYPKLLARKVIGGSPRKLHEINCIIMIRKSLDHPIRNKFVREEIYIIVEPNVTKRRMKAIERAAAEIKSKPPLSKFGIISDITIHSVRELRNVLRRCPRMLWLYSGISYRFERVIKVDEWALLARSPDSKKYTVYNTPPILSNVRVAIRLSDVRKNAAHSEWNGTKRSDE